MALAEELSGLSLHWPHRPPGPARQYPLAFLGIDTSFLRWESWGQKSDPRGLLQSPLRGGPEYWAWGSSACLS